MSPKSFRNRPIQLLLDCDGILCDFVTGVLSAAQEVGVTVDPDTVDTWDIFQVIENGMGKDARDAVVKQINQEGFCAGLPVFPGAKETVSVLKELGVDIVIVTSPWISSTWVYERTGWLKNHFGFSGSNIIHTSGKWRIKGDLFIDDHPVNVERWAAHNGYEGAFVWNTSQNKKDEVVMPRLHSWADLLELVKARHVIHT